jgi:phage shock protein PspC (stress-responsive transcriptional regulator)
MCTLSKIAQKDDFGGLTAVPGHEKTTFLPKHHSALAVFYICWSKKSTLGPMLNHWLKDLVERQAFGVCQYIGEKMHIAPAEVRKYFIYVSFIAMGSPLVIYLVVAFWMNLRRYMRRGQSILWE